MNNLSCPIVQLPNFNFKTKSILCVIVLQVIIFYTLNTQLFSLIIYEHNFYKFNLEKNYNLTEILKLEKSFSFKKL